MLALPSDPPDIRSPISPIPNDVGRPTPCAPSVWTPTQPAAEAAFEFGSIGHFVVTATTAGVSTSFNFIPFGSDAGAFSRARSLPPPRFFPCSLWYEAPTPPHPQGAGSTSPLWLVPDPAGTFYLCIHPHPSPQSRRTFSPKAQFLNPCAGSMRLGRPTLFPPKAPDSSLTRSDLI